MKKLIVKTGLCVLLVSALAINADAQRTKKRTGTNPPTNPTNPGEEVTNNNNNAPAYNPNVSIPFTYDTSGAENMAAKPSLRIDNAFDKGNLTTRTPLPYEHLRWDDALYAEKVWRELDLREKMNQTFRYEAEEDNGSQMFINILLKAVEKGDVTAWTDDRFTTPLSLEELTMKTAGGFDTVDRVSIDDPTKIEARVVTKKYFDPKTVLKLRIKEEWVFDRESSRMFCRILGIAPVQTVIDDYGNERGIKILFWIYYPDLRPVLTKYEVYNPKNMGQSRMTWEELFESRMFSSYVLKSTMDNASNKYIRQYIKDPILALLEGDNIKEKIFNFEQDLWSY